ncbi:MAG: ribosome maturation factor RimM [Gammaproteobacteria bacterium]
MSAERVIVGRLAGVYGVKGWLRVQSFTQPIENILDYGPWQIEGRGAVKPTSGRAHGKGLIVHLEGIDDRDQAAALVGRDIDVDRSQLPELDSGEYYWSDLVGLSVVNREGEALGTVGRMVETGAHDVMVVEGERERLIPYARDRVVDSVDLKTKCIVVDWDAEF